MEITVNNPLYNKGFLGRIEPRIKIVTIFLLIIVATSLKSMTTLTLGSVLALCLLLWARVPARQCIKRILWILPFAGVMLILMPFITPGREVAFISLLSINISISQEGIDKALMLSGRVLISVLALIFLTLTTNLTDLFYGLRRIGMPGIMVSLLAFTIRYITVLADELQRMLTARKSRGFTTGTSLLDRHTLRTLTELIGVLFIRSYERGERVFNAMLSRGFSGENNYCQHYAPAVRDWFWSILIILFFLGLKALELGGFV